MNINEAYTNLASAIVNQSIKDYKASFKDLSKLDKKEKLKVLAERYDLECFLKSKEIDLYCELAGIDKHWVIKKFKEVRERKEKDNGRYQRI